MNELIYPSLHLFTYNLRDSLGSSQEEIRNNHHKFWGSFPKDFPEHLKVPLEVETKSKKDIDLLTLNEGQAHFYRFDKSISGYKIEGFYYPVRLSDTYSLQFNCSIDDKVEPQPSICFQVLKSLAPIQLGTLGKTWILSGYLSSPHLDCEALAEHTYFDFRKAQQAEKNSISREWEHRKLGKFLGATIFEVWRISEQSESTEDNIHVLILLYPDPTNLEAREVETAKFYQDWMDLFCFHHKISWAYCQAQKHKNWLKENFFSLQKAPPEIQNLFSKTDSQRLTTEHLQAALKSNFAIHAEYSLRLNRLQLQSQTIDINVYNYQKCLSRLIREAGQLGDTNLNFLKDFGEIVAQQYQHQMSKDYTSLSSGLALRETLTETLKGFVPIEQAERDRRLEDAIAVVGFGVGTATVAATVFTPLVQQITQPDPAKTTQASPLPINTWLPWILFFLSCLVVAALASYAGLTLMRCLRRHAHNK